VCGTNRVEHVEEVAAAVRKGPADEAMKDAILRDAVDLGQYVCRQCGVCTPALMDTVRLEGTYDRQMIDYLPHDPADYALRVRLAHWFAGRERAAAHFAATGYDPAALIADAEQLKCPYGIDVASCGACGLAGRLCFGLGCPDRCVDGAVSCSTCGTFRGRCRSRLRSPAAHQSQSRP
jgi:hypothetical protein